MFSILILLFSLNIHVEGSKITAGSLVVSLVNVYVNNRLIICTFTTGGQSGFEKLWELPKCELVAETFSGNY